MTPDYERIAYWLLPDSLHMKQLNEIINDLANRYNGPIFQSHLTIGAGNYQSMSEVKITLDSLSNEVFEFSLSSSGIGFEEIYTKSCYIKIEEETSISLLTQKVANRIPDGKAYRFIPHVSLFYGQLSEEEREFIYTSISSPSHIVFSELAVVGIPKINLTKKDVEKWVELEKISLNKR